MGQAIDADSLDFIRAHNAIQELCGKYYFFKDGLADMAREVEAETSTQRALEWLREFEREHLKMGPHFLTIQSGNESIKSAARAVALRCETHIEFELADCKAAGASPELRAQRAAELISEICQQAEIAEPTAGNTEEKLLAQLMRLTDERWWRRQLRKVQARKLETVARLCGLVNKKRGLYCSNATLMRRREQRNRNALLLESMEAENDAGQVFTLAELASRGVSNPVNRCNELLTRVKGFEEWAAADSREWVPVFYTLTAPSRFHSHSRSGEPYQNWIDAGRPGVPEAMAWLSGVWVRLRSALARAEVEYFGLRVAEPHHCGCPHFHVLLWVPVEQQDELTSLFWQYAHSADNAVFPPTGPTLKRRFTAKTIDPEKGSAVGYVVKYICKNVHGAKLNGDEFEAGAIATALRVEAWATTWGIRQFQQVGGPSVTVWRELRRRGDREIIENDEANGIRAAANAGAYSLFVELMGGAVLKRRLRPMCAWMMFRAGDGGELVRNAYGELVEAVKGLFFGPLPIVTRLFEWTVRPKRAAPESGGGGRWVVRGFTKHVERDLSHCSYVLN